MLNSKDRLYAIGKAAGEEIWRGAAALCAGKWYHEMLGLALLASIPAEPAEDCNVPFGPPRDPGDQFHEPSVRLLMDDIVLFIYPDQTPERRAAMIEGLDAVAIELIEP